jgi:hypothetical protein
VQLTRQRPPDCSARSPIVKRWPSWWFGAAIGCRLLLAAPVASAEDDAIDVHVGAEVSGYHDSLGVDVLTPSVLGGVEHVTDGWGLDASFLVDVVTAASPDIVTTASPPWTEVRFVPGLSGHVSFGAADLALMGAFSHEPDYLSATGGARLSVDLADKMITPMIGYSFGYDVSGRSGTAFSVFGHPIQRHGLDAGLGLVLTRATYLWTAFNFVHEDGDSSKPYRHVPMFDPDRVSEIVPGLDWRDVNLLRLPERPLEQLPLTRQRYALAAQLAHRFGGSTLRINERLYVDSWGVKGSTTDLQYVVDAGEYVRLWPHGRFHVQGAADFYRLAYAVERDASGDAIFPALRTGDRELGPLWAATLGAGLHVGITRDWGVGLTADAIYTHFDEHLFVTERWAGFAALSFEGRF